MKSTNRSTADEAQRAIQKCLERVPFIAIERVVDKFDDEAISPDFLVSIGSSLEKWRLAIEVKNSGQPRIARLAINSLKRYMATSENDYGVFMAPFISEKAANICEKEGVGYIDFSGNCRISFGQVYIEQNVKSNIYKKRRDLRSLYSPKAERVLRAIISNPTKVWKLTELASVSKVSLGQTSNVKKLLLDREWIKPMESGFSLTGARELILEWGENYNYRRNKIYNFYSIKSLSETEADIAQNGNRYGWDYSFTGFSASSRLAPAVRYNRVQFYIREDPEIVASTLGFKKVDSGANVMLLVPYDDGVLSGAQEVEGIRIVSPIQAYLDLLGFRGRGEEAANEILSQIIRQGQW